MCPSSSILYQVKSSKYGQNLASSRKFLRAEHHAENRITPSCLDHDIYFNSNITLQGHLPFLNRPTVSAGCGYGCRLSSSLLLLAQLSFHPVCFTACYLGWVLCCFGPVIVIEFELCNF